MILNKKVTKAEYPLAYLKALNGYMGLAPKELTVLATILGKRLDLAQSITSEELLNKVLFSIDTRKEMAKELNNMPFQGLSVMIKQLAKKGALVLDSNNIYSPAPGLNLDNTLTFNFNVTQDETRGDTPEGDLSDSSTETQPTSEPSGESPQVPIQESVTDDEGDQEEVLTSDSEGSTLGDLLHTPS